jgi:hypothetical protein
MNDIPMQTGRPNGVRSSDWLDESDFAPTGGFLIKYCDMEGRMTENIGDGTPKLLSPNTGHWEVSGVTGKASLKGKPSGSESKELRIFFD